MNRSRSCDSSIRDHNFQHSQLFTEDLQARAGVGHNRESLCMKLNVTEEIVNEIACQLNMLKDYLTINACNHLLSENTICYLEKERDRLIENLDVFEARNMDLKDTIYAIGSPSSMSNLKLMEENNVLAEKIGALEFEKNVSKTIETLEMSVVLY